MLKNHSLFITLAAFTILLSGCQHLSYPHDEPVITIPEPRPPENNPQPQPEVTAVTETYADLWERVRAGYGLPTLSDQQTKTQLNWFVSYRKYFIAQIPECQPYLHYVVTELQANNIPLEIALLPFIESAYNPSARSPGRNSNVGMWQIAPITGKTFGLAQNKWYDGRKDVIASTDAAVRLFKKLYVQFDNDWLLAIAAYNAGDGRVRQAINSNKRARKPTDFWSLPLPISTQNYVKKLAAFAKIILHPNDYAFVLPAIPDEPYFVTMALGKQIDLAQLAKTVDIDARELKKINAGLNGWLTDPTTARLLLAPIAKAEMISANLNSLPTIAPEQEHQSGETNTLVNGTYKVIKGDSLSKIARHFGVSIQSIVDANNINNNLVKIGQVLHIPGKE